MRKLLTILVCLLPFLGRTQSPTVSAGSDQTIYLTLTNQVSVTGTATNYTSVQWSEVSSDYSSGATIVSPTSLGTAITGLPQGVFYFQLKATGTGGTAVDTMMVKVDYAAAPGTLLRSITQAYAITAFMDTVNDRHGDTLHTLDQEYYPVSFPDGNGNQVFFDRSRKNGEFEDWMRGKFYSILEDGYGWNNNDYARCEMSFGSMYNFDTTKTYTMRWKGYFPQGWSTLKLNQDAAIFMQIHSQSGAQNILGTQVVNQGSGAKFVINDGGTYNIVAGLDSFVNKTHTVEVTFKEGGNSNGSFYKVKVDGVQYYQKTSNLVWGASPAGQDYPKLATLYDYGRALVSPDSLARGRKFSMVTEDFAIYDVTTPNAAPTMTMGGNQNIASSSTTISAAATWASGHTGVYKWTETSGGSYSFSSPTSASTNVTGLSNGTYVFRCTGTQDDAQTVYKEVTVVVNINVNPPSSYIILRIPTKFINQ